MLLSTTRPTKVSAIKYSPAAQIPADHNNNSDVMQKKLIVCPISSHDPVSETLKKNASVMPAVHIESMNPRQQI